MQISKSEYMMFLKHPIYLWLKKYDKAKLPPVDDALQAIFNAGHIFESFAEQLLPPIPQNLVLQLMTNTFPLLRGQRNC